MHTVITSFSPYGYHQYGRHFLDTFHRRWPLDVRLVVYVEDGQPEIDKRVFGERFVVIDEVDAAHGWREHFRAIKQFPLMLGDTGNGYAIRYDARMARKTFMQAHALGLYKGKVFWLDADTLTHADVPFDFLDTMLPDDKFSCFLGRENFYTESGFLGFNADHPLARDFMAAYTGMFTSGKIFTFPFWHDCMAYDAVREGCDPQAFRNLGAGVDPGPGRQVFINSVLGAYMDHLKGPRKSDGRSPLADLTIKRTEPYWQVDAEPMVQTR